MPYRSRTPVNDALSDTSSPATRQRRIQRRPSTSTSSSELLPPRSRSLSGATQPSGIDTSTQNHQLDQLSKSSSDRSVSPDYSTKIVVERLTKNVTRDHLFDIFGQFGPIRDLDLPISHISGSNRGTAYILYKDELNAEAAISHMHEAQLDGSTINVSIVLPRQNFRSPPPFAKRGANFSARNSARGTQHSNGRRSPARSRTRRAFDTYKPRTISRSRSRTPPEPRMRQYSESIQSGQSRSPTSSTHQPHIDDRG